MQALKKGMVINMEIERKYAIKEMPEHLEQYNKKRIEQGYLCHNPILRIRKSNDDYILTYKSKEGISKQKEGGAIVLKETELALTKEAFLTLKEKTEGNMVCKTRYLIPLKDGLVAELDVFAGALAGLVFAEVEFPNEEAADAFAAPNWFGADLSFDKRFSNYYLSQIASYEELGL